MQSNFLKEEMHEFKVTKQTEKKEVTQEILCTKPTIILAKNVFTEQECDDILSMQVPFQMAEGWDFEQSKATVTSYRTSSLWYDNNNEFSWCKLRLKDTFSFFSDYTVNHFEHGVRQRYQSGQYYKEHCDFFRFPGVDGVHNDRVATCICYLNDGFSGGATRFSYLDFDVIPVKGSVLFFVYNYEHHTLKLYTQHIGMPVETGEKQIMTYWVRECDRKPFYP